MSVRLQEGGHSCLLFSLKTISESALKRQSTPDGEAQAIAVEVGGDPSSERDSVDGPQNEIL